MRKKRILYCSNHSKLLTGFGKNTKNLLKYLYSTGKFEIMEFAAGFQWSHPDLRFLPWQGRGTLPDNPAEINELNKDPVKGRNASYGEMNIEKVVSEFKPDICFFVEDAWGVTFNANKNFWGKIPCVFWVTQDSLPLVHFEDAKKTPYYWCWSSFATNEFHRLGQTHVKTQYPLVDLQNFRILSDQEKRKIRAKHNISEDTFIVTQVSRNQLRKLFPNQIEGYAKFKRQHPEAKSILLFVTNFAEGWDIMRLADQHSVPRNEIYCAYVSHETGDYILHPFTGNDVKCPWSGKDKAVHTVNVVKGVTEEQLNEIYNITDVLSHPATSGACELPLVEAAAAGKILLTVDYSFGEDVMKNKAAIAMEWAKYIEIGTQFIKASPQGSTIAKLLSRVYKMDKAKVKDLGNLSRRWALENYDLLKNGKEIESFIDSQPLVDWDKVELNKVNVKNDKFPFPDNINDDNDFITKLYKEILFMDEKPGTDGHNNWMTQIKNGVSRQDIYNYFINVARQENAKNAPPQDFGVLLDNTGNKRALFLIKESLGDCFLATSLFESFKQEYPNTDLYVASDPKFHAVFEGNPHIHKVIPYLPFMESELSMIGQSKNKGYFDYYFHAAIPTQRQLNYLSQLETSIDLNYV